MTCHNVTVIIEADHGGNIHARVFIATIIHLGPGALIRTAWSHIILQCASELFRLGIRRMNLVRYASYPSDDLGEKFTSDCSALAHEL